LIQGFRNRAKEGLIVTYKTGFYFSLQIVTFQKNPNPFHYLSVFRFSFDKNALEIKEYLLYFCSAFFLKQRVKK